MTTAKLRAAMKALDPSIRVASRGDGTWTVRSPLDLRETITALGLTTLDHDVEGSRWNWIHVLTVRAEELAP